MLSGTSCTHCSHCLDKDQEIGKVVMFSFAKSLLNSKKNALNMLFRFTCGILSQQHLIVAFVRQLMRALFFIQSLNNDLNHKSS